MTTVNISAARTHFSQLLARVAQGEEVVIAKAGKPLARLVPMEPAAEPRRPGSARGLGWVADDFNAPLPSCLPTELA